MVAARTLLTLVVALVCLPAAAGSLFGNPEIEVGGSVFGLDTGDLDGDGVEDFVVGLRETRDGVGSAGTNREVLVVLNDGDGHAASRIFYDSGERPMHVTIGDVDADGDDDLIVSNFLDGTITLMTNNGDGTFVDALAGATVLATGGGPAQTLFVDVVGDALPDIVVSTFMTKVHENLGGGSFAAAVVIGDGGALGEIQAADLEPDGDMDIVTVSGFLLRNDGDDTFTREDVIAETWRSIAMTDLDSNGTPDLVAGTRTNHIAVYFNTAGSFGTPTLYRVPTGGTNPVTVLALGDVDADGDPDIAAGGQDFMNDVVFLLRNDGSGNFAPASEHRIDNRPMGMRWGHYDGDGQLDLAVARGYLGGGGGLIVLLGDGVGDLSDPRTEPLGGLAYGLDVGDVDGDGDPDVVAAMRDVSGVSVLLNDGAGGLPVAGFFDVTRAFVAGLTDELELVDFDGDDDLDLAISASRGYGVVVADNNGGGSFTPTQELGGVFIKLSNVEPRDIDGDDDPDFVAASQNLVGESEIAIFANDGAGNFPVDPLQLPFVGFMEDLALEDIDGDGDPDAVTPFRHGDVEIRRNDGGGGFGALASLVMPAGLTPDDVTLADLDGDMRPELLVGTSDDLPGAATAPFVDRVLVYPNDGSGNFGTPQSIATGVGPEHFAVADFDLDGDPDVAVANAGFLDAQRGRSGNITLLLNDGAGTLTAAGSFELGTFPPDNDYGERLQAIDHDRDGDFDLIYADPETHDLLIFVNRLVGPERVTFSAVLPGGFVTTDGEADGSALIDPIETLVATPVGGDIEIYERAISSAAPPGWIYFGQEVAITADGSTALEPLLIAFRVDASRIPAGSTPAAVRTFRDGSIVPPCAAIGSEAAPDPCFQDFTVEVDADLTLVLRSSSASVWNFGVQRPLDLGIDLTLDSPLGPEVISFVLEPWQVDLILESLADANDNGFEQMFAFPGSFQATGESKNWGPIELRLRNGQVSPFEVTTLDVEEDLNGIEGQLELPPYFEQGSGVVTLNAYIELEIPQQQLLLHGESPLPFVGSISSWPPAPGQKLESQVQVPLFDEQNNKASFTILSATVIPSIPPPPPTGTVPPPPPPIGLPSLDGWALLAIGLLLLASGAWMIAQMTRTVRR
jgi:hypothetical protein